jgi:hypothetical protein
LHHYTQLPARKQLSNFLILFSGGFRVWTEDIGVARCTLPLEPLHSPGFLFCLFVCFGIFKTGLPDNLPRAGFEPWSSWPLPPE